MKQEANAPETLRKLRTQRGMTVVELALLLDVTPRTVYALELGQTTPRLETAVMLQREFGIEPAAWVESVSA